MFDNKIIRLTFILNFLLIFSTAGLNVLAQETDELKDNVIIDNQVTKLKQKVLLSNEQTDKVKDILRANIENIKTGELTEIMKLIDELLDEKQKVKYDIICDDWFAGLVKSFKR